MFRPLAASESGRWSRRDVAALSVMLAAGLAVRWQGFGGSEGSDDLAYAQRAIALARGEYTPSLYVFDARLALWTPLVLLYRWFGVHDLTTSLLPLLTGLGTVVLITLLGRRLYDARTGWIAGILYAALPIDAHLSTVLLPEGPLSFWIALAALLMLQASGSASLRRRQVLALAAGFSFGLAWLTKESCIYAATALLLAWLWHGERQKSAFAATVAGLALVIAAEMVFYAYLQLTPFFRWRAMENTYEVSAQWFLPAWPTPTDLIWRWCVNVWLTLLTVPGFGGLFWLALPAMMVLCLQAVRVADAREARFLVMWFGILLLLFMFGSTSLREYRPLIMTPRYLALLNVPATLLAAAWFRNSATPMGWMSRHGRGLWIAGILPLALVLLASSTAPDKLLALARAAYGVIGEPRGQWSDFLMRMREYLPHPLRVVLFAGIAWSVATLGSSRRWQVGLLILLTAVHISMVKRSPLGAAEQRAAAFLADHPEHRVLSDSRTAQVLDYLTGFHHSARFLEWPNSLQAPANAQVHMNTAFRPPSRARSVVTGDWIVLNPTRCRFLQKAYGYPLPAAIGAPRAGLRPIYSVGDQIAVFEAEKPMEW